MTSYPDEMLMAYVDGELPPEEARALEARLAADPALRLRLEPFTAIGGSLAEVFERPLREPVPERLAALVWADADARRWPGPATRLRHRPSFLSALGATLFPHGLSLAGAGMAAALLLIGATAGVIATRLASPDAGAALVASDSHGHLVATGLLRQALSSVPSEVSSGDGKTVVTPVKSFRDHDHHLCRQYEMDVGAARLAGIACRDSDGAWQIALHSERAAGKVEPGSYQTAGPAEALAIKAAVDAMIEGDPLSPDDEKSVLSQAP